jgi:hypothetical protein
MNTINRTLVLNTLIQHETLTIDDLAREENLGLVPNQDHLDFLLNELTESGYLKVLNGVVPCTYTITDKGIKEGARLKEE